MPLLRDQNKQLLMLRNGDAIGGLLRKPAGELTNNTWERLMPSNNNAQKVMSDKYKLNIGALRHDLLDIGYWHFYILNAVSGLQENRVVRYDNNIVTLQKPIQYFDVLPDMAIEYVMFPDLVIPLSVYYNSITGGTDPTDHIEVGWTKEDTYTVAAADINTLAILSPRDMLLTYASRVDHIFYRVLAKTTGVTHYNISYGEHAVA